jgi:small conductance mechanosensitive channel
MSYSPRKSNRFLQAVLIVAAFAGIAGLTPVLAQGDKAAVPGSPIQEITPKRDTISDLEILLKTLENPQEREKLTRQLRALIERERLEPTAKPAEEPAPEGKTLFEVYQRLVRGFEKAILGASANLKDLPNQVRLAREKLQEKENLLKLWDLVWKLVVVFVVALGLSLLVRRYSQRAGQRVTLPKDSGQVWRFVVAFVRSILSLLAPGVFVLAVFLALPFLNPDPLGAAVILTVVWAYFLQRVAMALVRMFLSPEEPSVRFLPVMDETALYWNIWSRRIFGFAIYGYCAVQIIQTLGASTGLVETLSGLYGLCLAVLSIVLILQQRKELRSRIKARPESEERLWKAARVGRAVLSAYWHVIVIAYILGAYCLWVLDYPDALGLMVRASFYTVALVALCLIARHFIGILLGKVFRIPERITTRFAGLERRVNRYVQATHRFIYGLLYIVSALLIFDAWGINLFGFLFSDFGTFIILRAFGIAVTVAVAFIVLEAGNFSADVLLHPRRTQDGPSLEPPARLKTLVPLAQTTLKVATIAIAVLIVMGQIGINITPVLAGAGILGLAVGFGAQSLVKDIISGLFIILEDSMSVGDVVILKGTGGLVEKINLRTIRVRDLSGNVHVFPHSNVDMITNMTKEYSRYVLDVGVAYREDTDQVVEILKEIGTEMQADPVFGPNILEPIEILGVDRFEDSAVIVRARLTTKPIKQWNVGREFNRRMKKIFDERGIEIPFPHRTIFFGEPKEGTPPPLYMEQVARAFEKEKS